MGDVIVLGSGHNGLVASILLARAGQKVTVLERRSQIGGASTTEYPFSKAPQLGSSTGAYLLGLMPPELMKELGLELPLVRRDPHYFLPTTGKRYLLFGSDQAELHRQFASFFSEEDWNANQAMNVELAALRDDLAPAWLLPPLRIEETAERFIRPGLRKHFMRLCLGSVRDYLERWDFKSDLVKAMYAVTDGFSGVDGDYETPGTGLNFLVHNMCRLPEAGGTWMIVKGGMGTVTQKLGELARAAGVEIRTECAVARIVTQGKVVQGVALENGEELRAPIVVSNADPFHTLDLVGESNLPKTYVERINKLRTNGTTLKVNLALSALPRFTCMPENRGQFGPTIHLLPDEDVVLEQLRKGYAEVKQGKLTEFPSIEWYVHTPVDPAMTDPQGRQSAALFVEWVPYEIAGSSWEQEESRYVRNLLSICDRFAPGTSDRVEDTFVLTPPKIEQHFGITRGQIQHVDNKFGFTDRAPYETPVQGLYLCGAGCHPAGAVTGAPGYNAAKTVLRALGIPVSARV